MFESIMKFFNKIRKKEEKSIPNSKEAAKERLHLVLMQDRANVSADFLELMKQEIIDVIKKYIDIDEGAIDVRLTNKENEDGTNGAPALYANIPILNIKNDARKIDKKESDNKVAGEDKEAKKDNVNKEENKNNKTKEKQEEKVKENNDKKLKQDNDKKLKEDKIEKTEKNKGEQKKNSDKEKNKQNKESSEKIAEKETNEKINQNKK